MKNSKIICDYLEDYSLGMYSKFIDKIYYEEQIKNIINLSIDDLIFAIRVRPIKILNSTNIPMFSNLDDCTYNICYVLNTFKNKGFDMEEVGYLLLQGNQNKIAKYKYGETHSKAAQLLGLVTIDNNGNKNKVFLTELGYYFLNLNEKERTLLMIKLILKSNIVQFGIKYSNDDVFNVYEHLDFLSKSSINRRLPNIKSFYNYLLESEEYDFKDILDNINFNKRR